MWWHWLLVGCVGAWFTLFMHELAHCFVVWGEGKKVTSFIPFPHRKDGRFYFGRMQYEGVLRNPKLFYAAPCLMKAPLYVVVWTVLGLVFWLPLLAAVFWELADIANFVQGYIRRRDNDGGRYRRA